MRGMPITAVTLSALLAPPRGFGKHQEIDQPH
jgi:hypothetical protein